MEITTTPLRGVLVVQPQVYSDERGFFFEVWNRDRFAASGLPTSFVQDNVSYSRGGVLRGLHFQNPSGQGKLVAALQGEVFDVAVDISLGSPTFGRWWGVTLSAGNRRQIYIPPGYAHGFAVVSESALIAYKCTEPYSPQHEGIIRWDDPDLQIAWPVNDPILNAKDRAAPPLRDFPRDRLPRLAEHADAAAHDPVCLLGPGARS